MRCKVRCFEYISNILSISISVLYTVDQSINPPTNQTPEFSHRKFSSKHNLIRTSKSYSLCGNFPNISRHFYDPSDVCIAL